MSSVVFKAGSIKSSLMVIVIMDNCVAIALNWPSYHSAPVTSDPACITLSFVEKKKSRIYFDKIRCRGLSRSLKEVLYCGKHTHTQTHKPVSHCEASAGRARRDSGTRVLEADLTPPLPPPKHNLIFRLLVVADRAGDVEREREGRGGRYG